MAEKTTADESSKSLSIAYEGSLADTGRMHLYELSRSQYAFARMIATVEHFRRTGVVVERIVGKANVEITVGTAKKGSYEVEVLVEGAKQLAVMAVSVPFDALLAYLWDRILVTLPRHESETVELARIRAAELQSLENINADNQATLQKALEIIDKQSASNADAIELARWALENRSVAVERAEIHPPKLLQMIQDFQDATKRQEVIEKYQEELERIDSDDIELLASRMRKNISDFALPLRRSADSIRFTGADNDNIVHVDRQRAVQISKRETSEETEQIVGRVEGYFRNTGVGKLNSDRFGGLITFIVPAKYRRDMRDSILAAMRMDEVNMWVRIVSDGSGQPTSVLLESIDIAEDL